MDFNTDIARVKELLDKAKDVLVVTHERPTFDSIGSALALSMGLTSLGKKVTVVCPDPMTVELSSFIGVNKVATALGKKNFVISLDYVDGSIEKVSYNIEGDKFNLVIEPRPGFETFSEDKVQYSYAGSSADLVMVVDTIHLGGLKGLYEQQKELFASVPMFNIDRHPNNAHFGQVNVVGMGATTTVELVGMLLSSLGVRLTPDMATNILNALYAGTNNFSHPAVTAGAFELAAAALKAGGKRFRKQEDSPEEVPVEESVAAFREENVMSAQPRVETAREKAAPTGKAPEDWLKPKIFKSSSSLL